MGSLEFLVENLYGFTMVLGLTQPLTERSNTDTFWGKVGRCVGLTTLPPLCSHCFEILGGSKSRSPKDLFRPLMG